MGIEDLLDNAVVDQLKKTFQDKGGNIMDTLKDLFPDGFMSKNTNFANIQDFIKSSGISINSIDDVTALLDKPGVNEFVEKNTKFSSLKDMFTSAQAQDVLKKLF